MEPFVRIPAWCGTYIYGPSSEWTKAWIYVLCAWHRGDNPSTDHVRRVTRLSEDKADRLMLEAAQWAADNGATVPASRIASIGVCE